MTIEYQEEYYKKAHGYLDRDEDSYVKNLVERLIEIGEMKKEEEVLEVGCGSGRFTIPILNRGYHITGVDLSENLLDKLRAKLPKYFDLELILGDVNTLPFKERFDCVIGFYILHHLSDLKEVFQRIRGMLKDEGRMIFLEPNPFNPLYYLQILLDKEMTWQGEKGMLKMTPKHLKALIQTTGFHEVELTRFGFFPPFVVNTQLGFKLEHKLEKLECLQGILPFQLIKAVKKIS